MILSWPFLLLFIATVKTQLLAPPGKTPAIVLSKRILPNGDIEVAVPYSETFVRNGERVAYVSQYQCVRTLFAGGRARQYREKCHIRGITTRNNTNNNNGTFTDNNDSGNNDDDSSSNNSSSSSTSSSSSSNDSSIIPARLAISVAISLPICDTAVNNNDTSSAIYLPPIHGTTTTAAGFPQSVMVSHTSTHWLP
ncbi:protein hairless-like isoform X2 [Varroa jacobsoni]|uniref:protein hairless-like isoform X2 n=1 Tax=Varroa jacobsoni TaxID=62625 RepID=UPI000BF8C995|nr:protein hairless-like isoform X2 [Varroa jacobsoni]